MAFLNPLAPGSSPGWPTRNGISLPIRRTMRPRRLRCLLTHMSALRELLATETTSHDASKPICHFWPWLAGPQSLGAGALGQDRKSLRPVAHECAARAPRHRGPIAQRLETDLPFLSSVGGPQSVAAGALGQRRESVRTVWVGSGVAVTLRGGWSTIRRCPIRTWCPSTFAESGSRPSSGRCAFVASPRVGSSSRSTAPSLEGSPRSRPIASPVWAPSLASSDSTGEMLRCLPHHEGSTHTPLRFGRGPERRRHARPNHGRERGSRSRARLIGQSSRLEGPPRRPEADSRLDAAENPRRRLRRRDRRHRSQGRGLRDR